MEQTRGKNKTFKVALLLLEIVFLCGLCLAGYILVDRIFLSQRDTEGGDKNISQTDGDSLSEEYLQMLLWGDEERAQQFIRGNMENLKENTGENLNLKLNFVQSLLSNDSLSDKQEGLSVLFDIAKDETLPPFYRAVILNTLLWVAFLDMDNFTATDSVFFTPDLQVLAPNNEMYAILLSAAIDTSNADYITARHSLARYMGELSYSTSRTPYAAMFLANWNSRILLEAPYYVRPENKSNEDIVNEALQYISQTEGQRALMDVDGKSGYLYWEGRVLGDLAVAGYTTDASFEDSFDEALDIIVADGSKKNNLYPNNEPLIHFYYATYLYDLYGEQRAEEAEQHVVSALQLVRQNEGPQPEGGLEDFTKQVLEGKDTFSTRYRYTIDLAGYSPAFAAYLEELKSEL